MQVANVEALNKQLGRLFNGYMNEQKLKTGKTFRNWTKIIGIVRSDLNKIRKMKLPDNEAEHVYPFFDSAIKGKKRIQRVLPKYKVGDSVLRLLDYPMNALGEKQSGTFRQSDFRYEVKPRKIKQIFYYAGKIPYRYQLEGIKNASFSESQLIPA